MKNTKTIRLTPKQSELLKLPLKRWNILSGATGGGKTKGANIRFIQEIKKDINENKIGNYLLVGRTLTTLERNVLQDLKKATNQFKYNKASKIAMLKNVKIFLEGANDRQAGEKIRGLNLKGAYCDEVVTYPKDFMDMLKSRLREPNAWCIATCNPDHPKHWFNLEYRINQNIQKRCWDFNIDDNKFLPLEFVKQIKKEYNGVLYQRYILGEWVNAEGSIYSLRDNNFVDEKDINENDFIYITMGVDIGGNKSKTTFVLTGILKQYQGLIILGEFKISENQTADNIINTFQRLVLQWKEKYKKFKYVFVDSESQIFINSFKKLKLPVIIGNSKKNKIIDRIQKTNQLINTGKMKINKKCKNLIEALETAIWNSKKQEDERLDDGSTDIDTLDAFEYSFEYWIKLL